MRAGAVGFECRDVCVRARRRAQALRVFRGGGFSFSPRRAGRYTQEEIMQGDVYKESP